LLPSSETGICWWGGENEKKANREWPAASENKDLIKSFIRKLGVEPFRENETGTSIIIPFLKKDLLNYDVRAKYGYRNVNNITKSVIRNYLSFSIQRWYSVRLNNRNYPYGAELEAFVCGKKIGSDEMPIKPIYSYLQKLYNSANNESDDSYEKNDKLFMKNDIRIRKTFTGDSKSGILVAVKLTKHDLNMKEPDNEKSPFFHIFNDNETNAPYPPIIAYLRKPGMVISWNDDSWIKGIKSSNDDYSIVLALFVPESEKRFNEEIKNKSGMKTLEEYLRACEKADHSKWNDSASFDIIERIRKNSSKFINDKYFSETSREDQFRSNLSLSRFLSGNLLPQGLGDDIGSLNSIKGNPASRGNAIKNIRGKKASFSIENIDYKEGNVAISWKLYWGSEDKKKHCVELGIHAENSVITKSLWEEEKILGDFPFIYDSVFISYIIHEKNGNRNKKNYLISDIGGSMFDDHFNIEVVLSEGTKIIFNAYDLSKIKYHSISGLLSLKYENNELGIQPVLELDSK